MNAIIIYKGRYGATRQYAEWLGEALQIPVAVPTEISATKLRDYDLIILGSSVYIGKLELSGWIKQNSNILSGKRILLFIVCATPPDQVEKLKSIGTNNIPDKLRSDCTVFYLHGRMLMNKLSWKDRILLKLGAKFVKDPAEQKVMLQDFDDVRKEHLRELIETIRGISVTEKTSAGAPV